MKLTMIAAIGKNRELGKENQLLFRNSKDMKFFRTQTKGHTVIMGRKTFESLPGLLPGRHHIVISRSNPELPEEVEIFKSLEDFLSAYKNVNQEIFVIGGAQIYQQLLPYSNRLLLTEIDASKEADAFFPVFDASQYQRTLLDSSNEDGILFEWVEYTK